MKELSDTWSQPQPTREDIVRTRLVNIAAVVAAVAYNPSRSWDSNLEAMEATADCLSYHLHSRSPGGMYDGAEEAEVLPKDWAKYLGAPVVEPKDYYNR